MPGQTFRSRPLSDLALLMTALRGIQWMYRTASRGTPTPFDPHPTTRLRFVRALQRWMTHPFSLSTHRALHTQLNIPFPSQVPFTLHQFIKTGGIDRERCIEHLLATLHWAQDHRTPSTTRQRLLRRWIQDGRTFAAAQRPHLSRLAHARRAQEAPTTTHLLRTLFPQPSSDNHFPSRLSPRRPVRFH